MQEKWCVNSKNGDIFAYDIFDEEDGYDEGETGFPRGTFIVYGDYLTTGIASFVEAEKWASEHSPCHTCKGTSNGKPGDSCFRCGSELSESISVSGVSLAVSPGVSPYSTN
jgi:hypothetical protein